MQKRTVAPFPIFSSQSKRPRQALYTHPNNIIREETATPSTYQGPTPSWKRTVQTAPYSNHHVNTTNSKYYQTSGYKPSQLLNQENQPTTSGHSWQPHSSTFTLPISSQSRSSYSKPTFNFAKSGDVKTREIQQTRAKNSDRFRQQTRVITVTAQSLEQWVQLSHQMHLIFEVFGIVNSQVSHGEFGSKRFLMKTSDGTIKCCFWEIDRKLPHLVRGKSYRVMGSWDTKHKFLKCVSVRPSIPEEEQWLTHVLQVCDQTLRHLSVSKREQ